MKEKILIANRGEIAIRIANACEELGLPYVTVYTEEDKDSMHMQLVERKGFDEKRLFRISDYRDPSELFAVADHTGCIAIHPGYGFLAEDYRFARRTGSRDRPLIFIGPRWEVVRGLGSKINTKQIARSLGIPTIPGSDEVIYGPETAESIAEHLFHSQEKSNVDHPSILVKASAGGGGMGIEQVTNIDAFRRTFRRVRNYAKEYFGDEGVLIEQCMTDFNHIEVQIVGDRHGNIVHYGTRNCSIQSTGRQKRIEVAPGFDPNSYDYQFDAYGVLNKIIEDSLKLCNYVNYDNVGTVEWVVTNDGHYYLLEVNTRIQVENEVSGKTAGICKNQRGVNLIKEQIRLALGDSLGYTQRDIHFEGTCIEFRIIAENTRRGFSPQSGTLIKFSCPSYEWSSFYSHVPSDRQYKIPTSYDPNLALGVVFGGTLAEAKQRGKQFLEALVVEGNDHENKELITNIPYLKDQIENLLRF